MPLQRIRPSLLQYFPRRYSAQFAGSESRFFRPVALADEFTTAVAAGALVRNCVPGPGAIIAVTDTTNTINISSGLLRFTGAGPGTGYTNQAVTFTGQSRVAGKVLTLKATPGGTAGFYSMGWNTTNPVNANVGGMILLSSSGNIVAWDVNSGSGVIGTYTAAEQQFAFVLRATGYVVLQKIGGRWCILYVHDAGTTATMYPGILRYTGSGDYDDVRVLTPLWQTPVLASDSFNRANGALGSTDGAGCEETGGSGKAWSVLQGTCAVASNVAAFSARDGTSGIGLAVVDAGSPDVVLECTLTTGAAAGIRPGVAFRVTDATNYWRAYIDNSANLLRIDEVVAGSVTNRASVAATVADSTAYRMLLICDGASVRAIHRNVEVATYASAATGLTATKHGLWCDTGIDGTFENFSCKPRYVDGFDNMVAA